MQIISICIWRLDLKRDRSAIKKSRFVQILLLTSIPLLLGGCTKEETKADVSADVSAKPVIAVTIFPEQTFSEAVCGDLAEVITMVPLRSSPATYEPTPKEMEQFTNAELCFTIGVPSEEAYILPKAEEIDTLKIVPLEEGVSKAYADREFAPGERGPYSWLSPKRAMLKARSLHLK